MFDAKQFLSELGIRPGVSKHSTSGWINIKCPFCSGHEGHHLGFNLNDSFWHCWRCGFKPTLKVIQTLADVSIEEAKVILKRLSTKDSPRPKDKKRNIPNRIQLPSGTQKLGPKHFKYLKGRGLSPRDIERKWDIKGTERSSALPWRLVIPITFNDKIVSWQTRDITGKADIPYRACKKINEIIPHNRLLYGLDEASNHRKALVVEGVFDVWNIGYGAVGTFGMDVNASQRLLLIEYFEEVFILFDREKGAQEKAETLAGNLVGIKAFVLEWEDEEANDPAELSKVEVAKLRNLIGRK